MSNHVLRLEKVTLTIPASCFQYKIGGERQIFFLYSLQVEGFDLVGFGYDCFEVNSIHKWFTKRDFLDARVIEAIDVIPDWIRPMNFV